MSYISIFFVFLGIFAVRVRTRRYVVCVSGFLFVWELIVFLIGPGVISRNVIDSDAAVIAGSSVCPGIGAAQDIVMTYGTVGMLSLIAWPFLLAAAMRVR